MSKEEDGEQKWKSDLVTIIDKEFRIFLIGKSGSGKSETGNTILGQKMFETGLTSNPVTKKFRFGTKMTDSRYIVIVDGPGLFFDDKFTEKDMKKELAKATGLLAPGPNVFLLVVGLNKFDESEIKAIDFYKKAFGEELMKYLIVVFTRGDDLERNSLSIHDYVVNSGGGQMKRFLASCENRYCSINNVATADIKEKQANYLVDMLLALERRNGRKIYKNAQLIRAQKEIDNRIQEMVNKYTKPLTYDDILTLRASARIEIVEEDTWFKKMMCNLFIGGLGGLGGLGLALVLFLKKP